MKTKVLVYAHAFAPNVGGVETVVMSLAKGLARMSAVDGDGSVAVTVATPTPRGGFNDESLPCAVVRQPSLGQLVALIRYADIIHIAGPCFFPLLVGLILRKHIVVEHHGFQTICPNGQLLHVPSGMPCVGHFMAGRHLECFRCNAEEGRLKSLKMVLQTSPRRWLCERVASNVTPTDWLATVLQLPRMTTIHHGVPADGKIEGLPAQTSPSTFGFIGRLVSTKGVHILLPAIQQLASRGLDFRLEIIGDGPERAALAAQAQALGLADKVEFLGHLPEEKVDEHLAGWTAVVMPSLGGEVFGMVAVESMFRGKPVVVSDLGALVEVTGEGGRAFASGDSNALAECLERILNSPAAAALQGQDARKRARLHFSEDRMMSEHLAVYQRLVAGGDSAC
jgi:glycosyltransferase involved in cell wall biosynthesis